MDHPKPSSPYKPVWVLFAIVLAFTAIMVISRAVGGSDKIPWRTDVAAATQEGARDKKPVLLYFTASWCGPCQRMKGATWSDAGVEAKLRASYVPVKVDIDQQRETAEKFEIGAVPTFIVLGPDGNPIKRATSFMPAADFLAWIDGN